MRKFDYLKVDFIARLNAINVKIERFVWQIHIVSDKCQFLFDFHFLMIVRFGCFKVQYW